ncbi:hypothetical protein [Helicobacter rodentium]|uniref:hypothetical protein n=1 Tax=Helicobacter rodentium TaxID=59617 RepID=UPI0023EF801F|nr:hypothetical protein [Helicobacter rodentium]
MIDKIIDCHEVVPTSRNDAVTDALIFCPCERVKRTKQSIIITQSLADSRK